MQRGYKSGLDVSPDATANRIVSSITAMFAAFQQQHPCKPQVEVVDRFTNVITTVVEQGFAEDREALDIKAILPVRLERPVYESV